MDVGPSSPGTLLSTLSFGENNSAANGRKRKVKVSDIETSIPSPKQRAVEHQSHVTRSFPGDAVYFIKDDTERQQVLHAYRQQGRGPVVVLRSPSDLEHHNLQQTLFCPPEGGCQLSPGRLFSDQPVILVLDLIAMSPGQIASLNDLLSTPPSFQGKPLGCAIDRIALVSPEMLEPGYGKAGPDCWRRLQAFPVLGQASDLLQKGFGGHQPPVKSDAVLLQERVAGFDHHSASQMEPLSRQQDSPLITIPFTAGKSWRTLLFGGLALSDQGTLCFQPGHLARLEGNEKVILQDAPWDDPDFVATLATTLREGAFEANGTRIRLPPSLELCRRDTTPEALAALKQRWLSPPGGKVQGTFTCLNAQSLEDALRDTQIKDGTMVSTDTMAVLLSGCQTLYLTSALSDSQWLQLLRRVEQLDSPLAIIDLCASIAAENRSCPKASARVQCQLFSHEATALDGCSQANEIYRLTPQTRWETLWLDTQLVSQNSMKFQLQETDLLKALKQRRAVVFHGLESCPGLAARLESLLANPPYLMVHGQKIELPKARVTFLWPEQVQQKRSPLWQSALQQAVPAARPTDEQHELIGLLEALPQSFKKNRPASPPWQARNFLTLLARQVEQESIQDGADCLLPIHHRRALHTLLVKAYRGDSEVYGYLKTRVRQLYPDEPPEQAADSHALNQWLNQHPRVNRHLLEQHFWTLARHCPVQAFAGMLPQSFEHPGEEALDCLARYLVGAAPDKQRRSLAQSLRVDIPDLKQLKYFDGRRRSRIRDALLAAGSQRVGGQGKSKSKSKAKAKAISRQAIELDNRISRIIVCNEPKPAILYTQSALRGYFAEPLLLGDFKDLARALVQGDKDSHRRQQRRLTRLAGRVQMHPLVFLQGEAGAGKSHMARAVAEELRKDPSRAAMPAPEVLSLGPETTTGQLFGQSVLKESIDGDVSSEFVLGPVLGWAIDKNPRILVLDEANMPQEGVLAPLAGLTETPPRISFQGKTYYLTEHHRVILTGNPEHYDGRCMDSAIKKAMLTLYYRPLDDDTLAECLIRPAFPAQWPEPLKGQATKAMLTLYQYYGQLLPGMLSPRDLQDVLSRINQTLRHHWNSIAPGKEPLSKEKPGKETPGKEKPGKETPGKEKPMETDQLPVVPTTEQVNQLVFEAFAESLDGQIAADSIDRMQALESWYKAHFPCEKGLTEEKQVAFDAFLAELRRNNRDIDLGTAPVVDLVQQYWLFLDLHHNPQRFLPQGVPQGRLSLLVEGPAGWGKDLLLNRVLSLWEQQHPAGAGFVHINASASQWDHLVRTTKAAMSQGQKLAISELNLLPSRYLEGLFNEVLTSDTAHPDFVLFATVNPASFGGRETLSTALKSRSTLVRLEALSESDLKGVLLRRTGNHELADWLSRRYQVLSEQLKQSRSPVQLNLDHLFQGADKLSITPRVDWPGTFESVFCLPLQVLSQPLAGLEQGLVTASEAMDTGRGQREKNLSLALNREQAAPLVVVLRAPESDPGLDTHSRRLYLPDTGNEEELLAMAHSILALDNELEEGTVVPGGYGGDITSQRHYEIQKYFAGEAFDIRDYRLELKQLVIDDGILLETVTPCDQGGIEPVSLPGWPQRELTLTAGQQLGSGQFHLAQTDWTPLPGLSARDQLVFLQCPSGYSLEVGRGRETGQLLVRLLESPPDPRRLQRPIRLNFIIEPDQGSLTPLKSGNPVQVFSNLCDPLVRDRLDRDVFSPLGRFYPAGKELQAIKAIPDMASRLESLARWCKTFASDRDVPGEGLDLLINLIREKQGVCRHRSWLFQVLSQYFGVPARIVANEGHQYVEISPDGGHHWQKIDLGGGGQCTYNEYFQPWSASIHQPPSPGLSRQGVTAQEGYHVRLQKLAKDAREKGEWSELIEFLNSQFPKCLIWMDLLLHESSLVVAKVICYLPWSEFVHNWYQQAAAETNLHLRAEKFGRLRLLVMHYMIGLYNVWTEKLITDQDYFATVGRFLPQIQTLIQQNIISPGIHLNVFETITSDKIWGGEANRLLDAYYQKLTRRQVWPACLEQELKKNVRPNFCHDLGGKSHTLIRALQRTAVDRWWSVTATGETPSLERMAIRQPAFPLSREQHQTRPVFIGLTNREVCNVLENIAHCFLDEKGIAYPYPKAQHVAIVSFFGWLIRQDSKQEWRMICNEMELNYGNYLLSDGCYPALLQSGSSIETCAAFFRSFGSRTGGMPDHKRSLNPERIKTAFGEPDALIIVNDDFLYQCFKEYLATMDLEKLKEIAATL